MNSKAKILLPISILAVAGLITVTMVKLRRKPESGDPPVLSPTVKVIKAKKSTVTLTVKTQGTVSPRTETILIPQVSGMITKIAPSFFAGGFFERGDILLEIDPSDYETALTRAEAVLAQANLNLAREKAQAEQAEKDWEALGKGKPDDLVIRKPQLIDAEAQVRSAEAEVEKARRDLNRTRISTPYAGMVYEKNVDIGQFVNTGTRLGKVFAVDYAEVRLPIPNRELPFLELPNAYRGELKKRTGPKVFLKANFAGEKYTWVGNLVRTEGTIDTKSRVLYAVVRVRDPYGRGSDESRPPLQVGLFVDAEINGKTIENVVVLPRQVLRNGDEILIVDGKNTLRTRKVNVLRGDEENVYLSGGVEEGERVCLTAVEFAVNGMKVRPLAVEGRGAEVAAVEKEEEEE